MTSRHVLVMDLIRASMDPASRRATQRADSPACQVVVRAAKTDVEEGGWDNVNMLAAGAGVAASGLTYWLAEHHNVDPAAMVDQLNQAVMQQTDQPATHDSKRTLGVVEMLKTLLTGPTGMQATAQLMTKLLTEDEETYYDLIVDLGDFAAMCIDMLSALGVSTTEDALSELEEMLRDFFSD